MTAGLLSSFVLGVRGVLLSCSARPRTDEEEKVAAPAEPFLGLVAMVGTHGDTHGSPAPSPPRPDQRYWGHRLGGIRSRGRTVHPAHPCAVHECRRRGLVGPGRGRMAGGG